MDDPQSRPADDGQPCAREASDSASDPEAIETTAGSAAQDHAIHAAEGLRGQIAALRQQVRDAQDTLRDHNRRQETGLKR